MAYVKARLSRYLKIAAPAFLLFYFLSTMGDLVDLYRKKTLLVLFTNERKLFADFNAFYNAGLLCRNYIDNHVPFYDLNVQMTSLAKVVAPYKSDIYMLSVNPPHYFLMCEPLSYFSPYHAWLLWTAISICCFVGGIYLLNIKRLLSRYEQICCVIGCLGTSTTYSVLRHGQNSFMLLLGTVLFWRLLESRKYVLSGLSLGLCMFKPQYLPALFCAGLMVGRLPFLVGASIAFITIYLISVSAFGSDIFQSWWDFISIKQSHPDFSYMMQSIRGELTICTTGRDDAVGLAPSAVILGTAIIFIAWLWFSFRKRWHEPSIFATLASITVSIMLFSSPHTQNNDYVLFYIPCVWMWQSLKELRSNGRLKTFLKVTIASYPYLSWVFLLLNALFLIFRVQPYFAVNVIVFVLSLSLVLAESRTVPAQARDS